MKNLEKKIVKLNIKNGDVILIKINESDITENLQPFGEKLKKVLDDKKLTDCDVIIITKDIDLEVLDEKIMFKLGWMKKKKIKALLSKEENN